ncbi:hypothetical protein AB6A40_003792 [Gnathostoma spinigerum]|uniref:Uncharacterized protein n=1 Tax=Gnathostoma spinigerum TaxID=75299 RepID=A0ABD6EJD0_9BILA
MRGTDSVSSNITISNGWATIELMSHFLFIGFSMILIILLQRILFGHYVMLNSVSFSAMEICTPILSMNPIFKGNKARNGNSESSIRN